MTSFFITGAGARTGKTRIVAAMLRDWHARGAKARALKPVATGYQPALSARSDAGIFLRAMGGMMVSDAAVASICPWRFADPLSPDLAAARAGRAIPFAELLDFCRAAIADTATPLLIEGAGGPMTPLDPTRTERDWISALGIPAVLVAGADSLATTRTLCAAEALRAEDIDIAAIVLAPIDPPPVPAERVADSIRSHLAASPPILVADTPAFRAWCDGIAAT